MLTRRTFHSVTVSVFAGALPFEASSQEGDIVAIKIRVDDSGRQSIPPILQQNLRIERDQSREANELISRAPAGRAAPIIFIILGGIAIPVIVQMMREALRQVYYGGVL